MRAWTGSERDWETLSARAGRAWKRRPDGHRPGMFPSGSWPTRPEWHGLQGSTPVLTNRSSKFRPLTRDEWDFAGFQPVPGAPVAIPKWRSKDAAARPKASPVRPAAPIALSSAIYRGQCATRKVGGHAYRGCNAKPNDVAADILAAKHHRSRAAVERLGKLVRAGTGTLRGKVDVVVAAGKRSSKVHLAALLGQEAASSLGVPFAPGILNGPYQTVARRSAIAGKRVLLVDDVVRTGRTRDRAIANLTKAGARSVAFYAVARAS